VQRIDLGPCAALLHERDSDRCVVLLPGAWYPTRAPLLWFAREVALSQDWSVLEVLDELPEGEEPFAWATDRATRALDAAPAERHALIGKSLTSAAAGIAADRGLPAAWLTPMLRQPTVVEDLGRASAPTLLIGGTADGDHWDPSALPDNPAIEVLELEGVDHALQAEGDIGAALAALVKVTGTLAAFLDRAERSYS
jgi:hypothetical protein